MKSAMLSSKARYRPRQEGSKPSRVAHRHPLPGDRFQSRASSLFWTSASSFDFDLGSTIQSTLAVQSCMVLTWSASTVPRSTNKVGRTSCQVGHLSTRRPTRTMRPSSALAEQNLQCLARSGRSLTGVCIFLACHAGIFSQFSDRVPASFSQVVASFFSHALPSVAGGWQYASRRTLPCLTDNHINLLPLFSQMPGSVLIGGHCLGLWLPRSPLPLFPPLADAQQCAQWRTLLYHLITLFAFLLPDVWQCAHRRTLSSSTHTPHTLPSLAVSSREDVVFTFISSLALGRTSLVAVMVAALGVGH
jgi:hypothetical protein